MNTPHASASLYVGDLQPDVTEALLFDLFKAVGPVASIRVCRDAATRRSLGYAYVNFHSVVDAERALDTLNYTPIKARPCRIMWSHRDPSLRKSGVGNVFIKNLDKTIDNKALYDTFATFGNILSCKVALDENSQSKGYGFVHYETHEAAEQAIQKVNGMLLNGKQVYVGHFIPKKDLQKKFTNVFVKNLDLAVEESKLQELFGEHGPIQSAVIMKDDKGESKGFGFVNFKNHEDAQKAVEALNNKMVGANPIFVGRAQKKAEREAELKKKWKELQQERLNKFQGVNLYIKNLDDSIDDEKLNGEFTPFGQITSAKVMKDEKTGTSKGFGFVCFKTPEEATKAVTEMNGRMLGTKPIYVALAQRKEVRRAQLEAQHAQRANGLRMQQTAPGMASPSLAPFGASPMFYPQPNLSLPPQAQQRLVYPQQMVPRPRWGAPHQPLPNYVVPVTQRQQRTSRQNQRAGAPPVGQPLPTPGGAPGSAPSVPRGPAASGPQLVPGGPATAGANTATNNRRSFKFTPNVRNQVQASVDELHGGHPAHSVGLTSELGSAVVPGPADLSPPLLSSQEHVAPVLPDLSSLDTLPSEERKQILGENLFLLIQRTQPALAGKITGMFLESMDNAELLHLLESEDFLNAKIVEAVEVLNEHGKDQVA